MLGVLHFTADFCVHSSQEGEAYVKKIGGIFAFKVKDGPDGKEALWVVDVKNGKGSVNNDAGLCLFFFFPLPPPLLSTGIFVQVDGMRKQTCFGSHF